MKVGQAVYDGKRLGKINYVSKDGIQIVFYSLVDVSKLISKVAHSTVSYSNDAVEKFLEVV